MDQPTVIWKLHHKTEIKYSQNTFLKFPNPKLPFQVLQEGNLQNKTHPNTIYNPQFLPLDIESWRFYSLQNSSLFNNFLQQKQYPPAAIHAYIG